MSVASNLVEVASMAVSWGGGMLAWTARKRRAAGITPISYRDVSFWGFAGLCFGLLVTFDWQAFHTPIIYLMLLAVTGMLLTVTNGPSAKAP